MNIVSYDLTISPNLYWDVVLCFIHGTRYEALRAKRRLPLTIRVGYSDDFDIYVVKRSIEFSYLFV